MRAIGIAKIIIPHNGFDSRTRPPIINTEIMDNINLITELLKERFVTKQELMELTHLNERKVRKKIQKIKMTQPVISTCTRNGYKIATSEDDIILALVTVRELVIKIKSIARCINRLTAFIGKYNDKEIGKLF